MLILCFAFQRIHSHHSEKSRNSLTIQESENTDESAAFKKENKDIFNVNDKTKQLRVVDLINPAKETDELRIMRKQLECITSIQAQLEEKAGSEVLKEEWQTLARVLDRLFVVLFLFEQVIGTFIIMLQISSEH